MKSTHSLHSSFISCNRLVCFYFFFFFFQAEDGIRDGHVTGVQTCALPILLKKNVKESGIAIGYLDVFFQHRLRHWLTGERSEERRVGKECRSRGWPYH